MTEEKENRISIQLTAKVDCTACKGTGWREGKKFASDQPLICGPGSRNQFRNAQGLCYCVRPSGI